MKFCLWPLALAMLLCSLSASADTILAPDTWYEFSFTSEGILAQGCFPADPSAPNCTPSLGTPTQFVGPPSWIFTGIGLTQLTVVDEGLHGDAFTVFNFGTLVGQTNPTVADFASCGDDPVICLADPLASQGVFLLKPGTISLSITPYASPYGGGSAYFRLESVPEPATIFLLLPALLILIAIFQRRRSKLATSVMITLAVLSIRPLSAQVSPVQFATIVDPAPDTVLTGTERITADFTHPTITPYITTSASFEYSVDQVNWSTINSVPESETFMFGAPATSWTVLFDTTTLSSPAVWVRARVNTLNGLYGYSPPAHFLINQPPVAVPLISGSSSLVVFNGASSYDPDGLVTEWDWDFGDGTTATGSRVAHTFTDTTRPYLVVLHVTDTLGASASAYVALAFASGVLVQKPADTCVCKSATLRGVPPDTALGPDADGKKTWAVAKNVFDGKTLGPLDKNPENPTREGEKYRTGYAFELLFEVDGDPKLCKEGQFLKQTYKNTNLTEDICVKILKATWDNDNKLCIVNYPWTGTQNELANIDVSTKDKCTHAGGTWELLKKETCTLRFPQDGPKYGPDISLRGTNYERPQTYKKHVGTKIIWVDTPSVGNAANGTTETSNWLSLVKGTDNKFCYVKATTTSEVKKGADAENLEIVKTDTGVAQIPGFP